MYFLPAKYRNARLLLTLLCGMAIVGAVPAHAAQSGPADAAKLAQVSSKAPTELDAAVIQTRIAVVSARTDIPEQERDLVLKRLHEAATRLGAAEAARKGTRDFADALQSAPKTIAALDAELVPAPLEPAPDVSDVDPIQMQLQLASLQAEAVSLRSKQRDLGESLRNMAGRPEEARTELTDLHRQLENVPAAIPTNASPLLIEASNLLDEATRQELSARIDRTEQELLSLPVRESIATAQRDLTRRAITQIDAAIAAMNTRVDAQRKHEAEKQVAQAHEFARRLAGQPVPLQDYASQTSDIRVSLKHLTERVDQERGAQQKLQTKHDEVAESRSNAEQILAIDRIGDESGRLLRGLQGDLPMSNVIQSRITTRRDSIVDARVHQLQLRQELRTLQPEDAAAKRYLTNNAVASTTLNLSLMTTLVENRRAALSDLDKAQGQLISVLSEAHALDSELLQNTGQLRLLLDERLLWLPSAEPLGMHWLQQLGIGVAWLVASSNWSGVLPALVSTLRTYWLATFVLLAAIIALFLVRRRLVASLEVLAQHVGSRKDSLSFTLQACAVTLMLALTWPLVMGIVGGMLRASAIPGGFASALGRGLLGVAVVWFMLGIFIDMCRAHGVFIAHFNWSAQRSKRLARALYLLLLVIVPVALLSAMATASGRPDLIQGIGRLAFLIGSLALALFLYRVFRPRRGALVPRLDRAGWVMRTRGVWSNALVAIPVLQAALAATGYYATARELQGRLFTSGWIILAVAIAFTVAMRGVLVATRRTAWRQLDERHTKALAKVTEKADGGEGSDTLKQQNLEPEIDAVSVSRQTRALLRAASGVVLAVLLWGIWSGLIPALNVFNNIVLWSHMVTTSAGDEIAVVTLGDLLLSLLTLILTVITARNLPGFLEITLLQRLKIDPGTRYAIATIGRYIIAGVGLLMAFNPLSADWSQLKWLVAALGVGLGFGLQEIVANFISGLIILFERPVRVGDRVSIGPTTGIVSRIRIRAITITDFDNIEVIVPNKAFITETVQNWSLTNEVTRLLIVVRVTHGSDVERTQQVMLKVATTNPQVLASPAPSAYFVRFGEHALEFELRAYVGTMDDRLSTRHTLHVALNAALMQAGIEVLFPQRDLHVRYPGVESPDQ